MTGEYTRYLPFVNIAFNYSILATLWKRIQDPGTPVAAKVRAVAVILAIAPFMLVIGVPFLIYGKLKSKKPSVT